jgi:hypothetical protein
MSIRSSNGPEIRSQIPIEPIIDMPAYELFLKIRKKNKIHSARHLKQDYLLSVI